MSHLIKIGNSQGIRIPKILVEQAQLEGKELKLQLFKDGLLITPEKKCREGWADQIQKIIIETGKEELDDDWLGLPLDSDDELKW